MKVFLVGYMGVGKSTIGKKIAARLGVDFFDLDALIVERSGQSIPDIFAERGEAYFREVERRTFLEMRNGSDFVLALGGGTPIFEDNMDLILASGVVVHLTLPRPVLIHRLRQGQSSRPLLAEVAHDELDAFVAKHLAQRLPHYRRAHLDFDTTDASAARLDALVSDIKSRYSTK